MGELAAWGRSTRDAFERARFRLLLSGTPFRSDNTPIPWVTYDDDGVSSADYAYGYTEALIDGVCRPVTFHTYDGDMEWVSDGRRRRADFTVALPAAEAARRLRTALDPEGDWVAHVLADAHRELIDLRAGTHPDAGGLVIAADKEHAEKLADRLARIAGERPEIVTSDAAGRLRADRPLRGRHRHVAGVGADGLRGRRRAAAAGRRVRDQRAHGAVLPPGRRPLHPPHARCRATQMSHLFLPERPVAEAARRRRSRRSATTRWSPSRRARRSSAASAASRATRSARCGRAPAATTTCCRPPRRARRWRCSPTPRPRRRRRSPRSAAASPRPRPRPPRRRAVAARGRDRLRAPRAAARRAPRARLGHLPPDGRGAPRRSTPA